MESNAEGAKSEWVGPSLLACDRTLRPCSFATLALKNSSAIWAESRAQVD